MRSLFGILLLANISMKLNYLIQRQTYMGLHFLTFLMFLENSRINYWYFFECVNISADPIPIMRPWPAGDAAVHYNAKRSIKRRVKSEIIIPHEIKSLAHTATKSKRKRKIPAPTADTLLPPDALAASIPPKPPPHRHCLHGKNLISQQQQQPSPSTHPQTESRRAGDERGWAVTAWGPRPPAPAPLPPPRPKKPPHALRKLQLMACFWAFFGCSWQRRQRGQL